MKISDLALSIIIVSIFGCMYIFNILLINIKYIKDNWPVYRCQPLVMPFATLFGHNASKNFKECIQITQKSMGKIITAPLSADIMSVKNVTAGLEDNVNTMRDGIAFMKENAQKALSDVTSMFFSAIIELEKLIVITKDSMGKMIATAVVLLHSLSAAQMTMTSAWAGPMGQLVRALCFHPDTIMYKRDKTFCKISELELNDVLEYGIVVQAIMKISNISHGKYIEPLYDIPIKPDIIDKVNMPSELITYHSNNVVVSGSHLIYDEPTDTFIESKCHTLAKKSELKSDVLYCLITSHHIIPIGGMIFHDWEDNNGSSSKDIL